MSSDSYEQPTVDAPSTVASTGVVDDATFHSYGGSGPATMGIMMTVVMVSYSLLFTIMLYSCMRSRSNVVYYDMETSAPTQVQQKPPPDLKVAELDQMWRKSFISKVYGIMCIQLLITVAVVFSMMQFGGAKLMQWAYTDGSWAMSTSFLTVFVSLIALMCNRQSFPCNFILLGVFTLSMSWMVGFTCTAYAAAGYSTMVVEAFAITSVIFIALTIFTIQSKIDFSFLGAGLSVALVGLLIWGFFAMYAFPSFVFSQVYALLGALIFSLYVVYDTWLITKTLSYDEYILGAINLYLDFINLFLFILRLLVGGGSRD